MTRPDGREPTPLVFPEPDLGQCETEPIHSPGSVQAHGVLLAVGADDLVVASSANWQMVLPGQHNPVGRRLAQVVGADAAAEIDQIAAGDPVSVRLPSRGLCDILVHDVGDQRLIEVEPPAPLDLVGPRSLLPAFRLLQSATDTGSLLDQIVTVVRSLTSFERVMVYRFDENWTGSVVAESADPEHGSFLGLRYPASDIPPQARALYLRNRVRLIPDVRAPAVALLCNNGEPNAIDLSDATLRAVSPVHIEYLTNMGVAASASVALILEGQLWGLVACHNYTGPLRPSQRIRVALDLIGGTASALLGAHESAQSARQQVALTARLEVLTERLRSEDVPDPVAALAASGLAGLIDADGAVVTVHGAAPAVDGMALKAGHPEALATVLGRLGRSHVSWSSANDVPDAVRALLPAEVAGVLAVQWGGEHDWLVWFRREIERSIRWGGDPSTPKVIVEPDGARIGPRASFDEYVETVRGECERWTTPEMIGARAIAARLGESFTRQVRRDRAVAAVMQQTLLLDSVPNIPGADVGIVYRPAGSSGLGGDWHDVYFLPDGRAVIAVGDVAGHGLEVAATMAQLRHALRAYVLSELDLGAAVTRLNELSRRLLPGEMTTLVIAIVDSAERELDLVCAGHLPPIVGRADGAAVANFPRQPAIGVLAGVEYRSVALSLDRNDSVVMYSDGLIERRHVPMDDQIDRLIDALASAAWSTSRAGCEALVAEFDPDGSDDTTVLMIRFDDGSPAGAQP